MRPSPRPNPIPALKEAVAQTVVQHLEGWTQEMAAELLRTDHPRVSNLRRGRLERFSLEQLILFAIRLRADVTIDVRWDPRRQLAPRP